MFGCGGSRSYRPGWLAARSQGGGIEGEGRVITVFDSDRLRPQIEPSTPDLGINVPQITAGSSWQIFHPVYGIVHETLEALVGQPQEDLAQNRCSDDRGHRVVGHLDKCCGYNGCLVPSDPLGSDF
jgi:hypothetical protein